MTDAAHQLFDSWIQQCSRANRERRMKSDILSQRRLDAREAFAAIEYRNKTETPILPGWYYLRFWAKGPIEPVEVIRRDGHLVVTISGVPHGYPLEAMHESEWFGPVREIREG